MSTVQDATDAEDSGVEHHVFWFCDVAIPPSYSVMIFVTEPLILNTSA
ncbi:hypothetical protein M7I_4067 [Glarea lozoyensis 74030]|uniref:Uncharacterized protein n=1 Tax=Glarea lozoyensis (strain ATCC 74030 / MF5533) TaxID=1104152 RepID=H0EN64_GLAL7|nr:hypothetical protein M7I_4067 [Glarea lozoyensis 74030]